MKKEVMEDMEKYVVKDKELPELLDRMKASGVRTFLLTNSGFEYSNVSETCTLSCSRCTTRKKSLFSHDFRMLLLLILYYNSCIS